MHGQVVLVHLIFVTYQKLAQMSAYFDVQCVMDSQWWRSKKRGKIDGAKVFALPVEVLLSSISNAFVVDEITKKPFACHLKRNLN